MGVFCRQEDTRSAWGTPQNNLEYFLVLLVENWLAVATLPSIEVDIEMNVLPTPFWASASVSYLCVEAAPQWLRHVVAVVRCCSGLFTCRITKVSLRRWDYR